MSSRESGESPGGEMAAAIKMTEVFSANDEADYDRNCVGREMNTASYRPYIGYSSWVGSGL